MAERVPVCAKCGRAMEAGFVVDRSQGGVAQSAWVDGAPTPSLWTGLKLKGHQLVPVTTYRCTKCGYLESYAASV
jgi:DNA-directed RNA polymerase subunit RPC12/RpoP